MSKVKPVQFTFFAEVIFCFLVSCNSKPETTEPLNAVHEVQPAPVSARPVHWGYSSEDGPEVWAKLSPVYALCDEGKAQSPINLINTSEKEEVSWKIDYKSSSFRIAHNAHMDNLIDNGHTIQVTVDSGSVFHFGNKLYHLKQFHFHTPSEHTLDGERMPMEMHFVHQASDGSLAVVGVLFTEGKIPNENFSRIIASLPDAKGKSKHFTDSRLEIDVHVPPVSSVYHYVGSLTTPPCSENVQWVVLRDLIPLTADQLKAFSSRIGPNNRPAQPLNSRTVKIDNLAGQLD